MQLRSVCLQELRANRELLGAEGRQFRFGRLDRHVERFVSRADLRLHFPLARPQVGEVILHFVAVVRRDRERNRRDPPGLQVDVIGHELHVPEFDDKVFRSGADFQIEEGLVLLTVSPVPAQPGRNVEDDLRYVPLVSRRRGEPDMPLVRLCLPGARTDAERIDIEHELDAP